MNSALSPMTSAASQRASMAGRSGAWVSARGAILNSRAHRILTSATEVRELASIAMDRTSAIGLDVYRATEATAPREASETSGTIEYGVRAGPRRYSMDGIRP